MTPFLANKGSEIVFVPQQETESGSIAMANKTDLLDLCAQMDMVVLGPGLSLDEETQELARDLAAEITVPLLLDGDGITALCGNLEILSQREAATVLTPHLGEMARITDLSITEINAQKVAVLQNTCEDLNAIIVLKGAHSSIGYPDRRVFVNMSGNSGMASAGSGDVLTGTIAAMYGLGLDIEAAVRQGVFVHGLAGDLAADAQGKDGVTAQTILDTLPLAMKSLRDDFEALRARYRGAVRI
jgi:NAD(P)H-hydrate epimerase